MPSPRRNVFELPMRDYRFVCIFIEFLLNRISSVLWIIIKYLSPIVIWLKELSRVMGGGRKMCELLGLCFNLPVRPDIPFKGFRHRGANNPDGWGIAFRQINQLRK